METSQPKAPRFSTTLVVIIIAVSLISGGLLGYSVSTLNSSGSISQLQNQVAALQGQVSNLQSTQSAVDQNSTFIMGENASLVQLYAKVKDSVVIIRGYILQYDMFRRPYYTQVQGSGFIYNYNGQMVAITNNHVIQNTVNVTVTFINGNAYAATVLGSDPYAKQGQNDRRDFGPIVVEECSD